MADGHGGKRTPRKPAPVSGPGALSRRTDGQPVRDIPAEAYGEAGEFRDIQSRAPMAQTPGPAATAPTSSAAAAPSAPITSLDAPTEYPDEPVTAGNPLGPGPGPEALASTAEPSPQRDRLRALFPLLARLADDPGTSNATRETIRYLRGAL